VILYFTREGVEKVEDVVPLYTHGGCKS